MDLGRNVTLYGSIQFIPFPMSNHDPVGSKKTNQAPLRWRTACAPCKPSYLVDLSSILSETSGGVLDQFCDRSTWSSLTLDVTIDVILFNISGYTEERDRQSTWTINRYGFIPIHILPRCDYDMFIYKSWKWDMTSPRKAVQQYKYATSLFSLPANES
jgi:hypothetical protein